MEYHPQDHLLYIRLRFNIGLKRKGPLRFIIDTEILSPMTSHSASAISILQQCIPTEMACITAMHIYRLSIPEDCHLHHAQGGYMLWSSRSVRPNEMSYCKCSPSLFTQNSLSIGTFSNESTRTAMLPIWICPTAIQFPSEVKTSNHVTLIGLAFNRSNGA